MLRLPFELTIACLYLTDLPTRIRASHISRAWRNIALSDRGLWASFDCATFVSEEDQLLTYEMLRTMVQRSRPLPFRIQVPHSYFGSCDDYQWSIGNAVGPDVHRLQEYDGPTHVLCSLHLLEEPLPSLETFICLDHETFGGPHYDRDVVIIQSDCDGLRLPNLRRLVGPVLGFSDACAPYTALRELVCTVTFQAPSEHLFRWCPNIVSVEFLEVHDNVQLPLPPFPSALTHITLHGEAYEDPDGGAVRDGVDFVPLLAWRGERLRHLTLFGAESIDKPVSQFLQQCKESVSLRISPRSPDIILTTEDGGRRWEIGTCDTFWKPGRLVEMLDLLSDRLLHLSIYIEHIGKFFNARFDAPHLVELELSLTSVVDDALPVNASEFSFIRAPNWQHLRLNIGGSDDDVDAHEDYINGVLNALQRNFRSLIVYDSDLLDSITVRSTARFVKDVDVSDLARFARRFVVAVC